MSITKTLFEVIAINIISPAKNINEEGKFTNNKSKRNERNDKMTRKSKSKAFFMDRNKTDF